MKAVSRLFLQAGVGLIVLGACRPFRARRGPAHSCDVPAYLLTSDSPLSKVAQALKDGQPLDILVVGSRSSTIGTRRRRGLSGAVAGGASREIAAPSR